MVRNDKIYSLCGVDSVPSDMEDEDDSSESRTDMDSHANAPVVGYNAFIVNTTGKTCDVHAFSPDLPPLTVPLVDAAVKYESPFDGTEHVLVIMNALHVPSMKHNLIPPFMIREAGIQLKDVPKIHVEDPSVDDHAILFPQTGFRIPLSLWGTFSYFPTTKPREEDLLDPNSVFVLTPSRWNPHIDVYARNEESMLDWEGNLVPPRDRSHKIVLEEIEDDPMVANSLSVSALEDHMVDMCMTPDSEASRVRPMSLGDALEDRASLGDYMMSVGATRVVSDDESSHGSGSEEDDASSIDWESVEDSLDDFMASAVSGGPSGVSPQHLSKVWRISHKEAEKTIQQTSQRSVRPQTSVLAKNYGTGDRMLRYKRINTYFFTDTFFATKKGGKSTRGHTCCQLFVTDKGFIYVVPMRRRSDVLQAIKQFTKEIGAPDSLVADMSGEQMSLEVHQFCQEVGTTLRALEEGTPWANKAELYIGLLKEAVRQDMRDANSPMVLWDYCIERRARIHNLTAKDNFKLHGLNPHTATTGEEGDISSLCQFGWYEWCYFREHTSAFPSQREVLGRVLGPSRGEGNEMCQWVLKANGRVVPRRSVRPLHTSEIHNPNEKKHRDAFDELIERRYGATLNPPKDPVDLVTIGEDEPEDSDRVAEVEDAVDSTDQAINQQPVYDKMINAEILLQQGDNLAMGKVKGRSIGDHGKTMGVYHENPILNSIIYDVEFPDGQVKEYAANILAENMLSQVDIDGHSKLLLNQIVDYQKESSAVPMEDKYLVTRSGQRRLRKTTKGWNFLVSWKDGTESWASLFDLKDSYPVELAEFAKARGIQNEPAFAWWVPHTLRRRNAILSAVKARFKKKTHKYGIEIPTSVEYARRLDEVNGNTLWMDALRKEMFNVGVAFEILDDGAPAAQGWNLVTGHLIWDVKMDFTRKARWVLDGHKTPDPDGCTYAGVVSRESVRIALTYAALNDLDVFAADIQNAYLQAPSSCQDYVICGPEFGLENVGKVALIHRALYGGKSAGRDFRNHLQSCMDFLGFKSCPEDPDVWMRPAIKSTGAEIYDYVLLYTDDTLVISENAESILRNEIGRYFKLKEESIGPPSLYLGGRLSKIQLSNGVWAWGFSSSQYVQASVKNVEQFLSKEENRRWKLPKNADTPMATT